MTPSDRLKAQQIALADVHRAIAVNMARVGVAVIGARAVLQAAQGPKPRPAAPQASGKEVPKVEVAPAPDVVEEDPFPTVPLTPETLRKARAAK